MSPRERDRFDALVEEAIGALPERLRAMLEETPVIVEDEPDGTVAGEVDDASELLGLHSGQAITERSVEDSGAAPSSIHLYRQAIVEHAGGWAAGESAVGEEIRVTLLHELGHQFGLDEDDLDQLGYA